MNDWKEKVRKSAKTRATGADPTPVSNAEPWPELQAIPNDLPAVLPFDYEMLPNAFAAYVSDVAERMQCPPDFTAAAIMVALAGVVGKKIGIRPKRHDDWLVIPNLWGAAIGRPGIMKTPAIRQPFDFLHRLEEAARDKFTQEQATYEVKRLIAEEQKKHRRLLVANAIKDKDDPEKAAQELAIEVPSEPTRRRYVVNDSTVEKLGELLNQNPNGLTAFRDEIPGLFEHLDKEGQEGARAFYIEAWDGLGKFTYDRIGRGTLEIESVTLSVFGGIQPGRLASYLRAAVHGGAGDDGLMQRFQLAVYPDVKQNWRNVDRWPDTDAKQKAWAIFQAMDILDPLRVGADPAGEVPYLRFDQEAQGLFDDWRAELEPRVRSGEEHPAIESHLAKYRSLIPSLALLIHLADGTVGPIGSKALKKALAWARYLESHARRIYAIVTDPTAAAAKALGKRIKQGEVQDGFSLRSVYRNGWAGLDRDSLELAAELLVELGWLREVEIETGGKPKIIFRINSAILRNTPGRETDNTAKRVPAPPSDSNVSDLPGCSDDGDWGEIA
ncbi:MAG TPA: YfjI family protein [Gemmataceae bacterium]|nr:YfjI family protein [Gemmataceae bacterium]